jgi:Mg2+ and Co2+ transporter CorA
LETHIKAILTRCEQLSELHDKHQDQQTNSTLFRLTMIQAVFFPMTIVTGLYGMNFKKYARLWD